MATTTPNLGLIKPDPLDPDDDDAWGPMLNGNADILDLAVQAALDAAAAANANANTRLLASHLAADRIGAAVRGGAAGGTANALTVTLTPAPVAITAGLRFSFIGSATNAGGGVTINPNGTGAITLVRGNGAAVRRGIITPGRRFEVEHDGTNLRICEPCTGWMEVERFSASGAAAYDMLLQTEFAKFRISVDGYVGAANDSLYARLSANGGASFIGSGGTGYGYGRDQFSSAGVSAITGSADDKIMIMAALDGQHINAAGFQIQPGSASRLPVITSMSHERSLGFAELGIRLIGYCNTAAVMNALRLLNGAGTNFSAEVSIEGWSK